MKRRKLGMALILTGTAVAVPASVGAVNQQVNLGAVATPFCSFSADGAFGNTGNITVDSPGRPTSTVHLTNPVNAGGFMQLAKFTFVIQTTCNAPSKYQLTTMNGGLTNPAPTPVSGTWLKRIDYSAHVTLPALGGATSSLITGGVGGATSDLETYGVPYSGQLQVSFSTQLNTSAPMVAGNYSDTLIISVNPQ